MVIEIGISSSAEYAQSVTSISLHDYRSNSKQNNNNNNHYYSSYYVVKIQSTCLRPYYIVRLSGPALIGMEKMHHLHPNGTRIAGTTYYDDKQIQFLYDDDTATTTTTTSTTTSNNGKRRNGTLTEITLQPVIISGMYDLEIIQQICNVDIPMLARHCVPNSAAKMMLNTPLKVYLEEKKEEEQQERDHYKLFRRRRRRYHDAAVESSSIAPPVGVIGHWKHLVNGTTTTTTVDDAASGVRTRFQLEKACTTGNCDISWFDEYDFILPGGDGQHHHQQQQQGNSSDNNKYDHYLDSISSIENRVFCFLGDSHSREMASSFDAFFERQQQQQNRTVLQKNNKAMQIEMTFPYNWAPNRVNEIRSKECTDVVIALGQWPISYEVRPRRPYDPDRWIHEMYRIVDDLHAKTMINIILRSIHYVPLGHQRTACPPWDWRMSYFVDVYNDRLRALYNAHPTFHEERGKRTNFFVDTNAVLGPVWDTSRDYNHLSHKTGIPEAIYILNEIVRMEQQGGKEESPPPSVIGLQSSSTKSVANYFSHDVIFQQMVLIVLVWFIIAFYFLFARSGRIAFVFRSCRSFCR